MYFGYLKHSLLLCNIVGTFLYYIFGRFGGKEPDDICYYLDILCCECRVCGYTEQGWDNPIQK